MQCIAILLFFLISFFITPFALFASTCPEISNKDASLRIAILSNDIRRYNKLYYQEKRPVISDAEYDRLYAELVLLEECFPVFAADDSPTRSVGSDLAAGSLTVRHERPMLSLSSSIGPEAVEVLLRKLASVSAEIKLLVQPKVDGLPVELIYQAGKLIAASTRGDGRSGLNVTPTILQVRGIPWALSGSFPPRVVVRGEIYADRQMLKNTGGLGAGVGREHYATLRHLAAGTLQSRNPDPEALAALRLFPFELVNAEQAGDGVSTDLAALRLMADWGFPVVFEQTRQVASLDEVKIIYGDYLASRDRQPFAMDGIVVKVDDLDLRRRLGEGTRAPFWAAAWKFPPATAQTEVRTIHWQVGRTGRRTPVAEVVPVLLGGVRVSRISLHNASKFDRLDLAAGDRVVVGLIGDVIPQVLAVVARVSRADNADAVPKKLPTTAIDACLRDGPGCSEQFLARLVHFVSKPGMNVPGFGRGRLRMLIEAGLVRDLPSLFRLNEEAVAAVPGFGDITARKLTGAIRAVDRSDHFRLVVAIGIPGVGKAGARRLAKQFNSLGALLEAKDEQLNVMPGRDRKAAKTVRSFFQSPGGRELLEKFRELGMLRN
ncbi:MAG: NAD-dependent DNA ligase LigA [Geobacteraceae bacterium]